MHRDFETDVTLGLTAQQVTERMEKGLQNTGGEIPTKTVGQIFKEHTFTLFNLLNLGLAVLIISVGSYKNALFMGIVVCNIFIGALQEIRAKKTVDKLSILSALTADALRDGKEQQVPIDQLVLDDIVLLGPGNQVPADMVVLGGECEVNESLITGEQDPVTKEVGEELLSGSFIVSGRVKGQVVHIGAQNFASQITNGAKYIKKPNSQILNSIKLIIKIISFVIVPLGCMLFYRQYQTMPYDLKSVVEGVVAALIGMIPEGLVLLTSMVMAVGVLRLSRYKALVQEIYCIETLARVDVLCLDKTGTITEGTMETKEVVCYSEKAQVMEALGALVHSLTDTNPTFDAVKAYVGENPGWQAEKLVPFSSDRKFSAASFAGKGTCVLGAFEFVFPKNGQESVAQDVEKYAAEGFRVLTLAKTQSPLEGKELPPDLQPMALVLIKDRIRKSARETLGFFKDQGVTLKVISGDNPVTVSHIAREAGLESWDKYVDCTHLEDRDIPDACEEYTLFGRVSPQQKLLLIKALKEKKHTVAMTGDGVNDTLALKEADCSIAMAAGSDAARTVSQLVLLNSDFSAMPKIVAEGRRIINNIQRSASLYLVKTIYSAIMALFFTATAMAYPFEPIQLSLISSLTIGIPSFFLALEPNKERVQGRFIENVLFKALPGGLTVAITVSATTFVGTVLHFDTGQISTLAVLLTAIAGFWVLNEVCKPYDVKRGLLFGAMLTVFLLAIVVLPGLWSLTDLNMLMLLFFIGAFFGIKLMMQYFGVLIQKLTDYIKRRRAEKV